MLQQATEMQKMLLELRDLMQARSIRKGDFTLVSGAKATYYCDTKSSVLSPRGAQLTGEILFSRALGRCIDTFGVRMKQTPSLFNRSRQRRRTGSGSSR